MFNLFSGGASAFYVFALGIMPYISASIIMQLMTLVSSLQLEAKKEGRVVARLPSTPATELFTGRHLGSLLGCRLESSTDWFGCLTQVGILNHHCCNFGNWTMFLMWLGGQITERGLGNGISIIIFAGIVAGLPNAVGGSLLELVVLGLMNIFCNYHLSLMDCGGDILVVFVERGQRRILVNYAKRQVGNKVLWRSSSHLPLKVEYGRRDSSDLRILDHYISGDNHRHGLLKVLRIRNLVLCEFLKDLASSLSTGEPVSPCLLYAVYNHFLLLLYTALVFTAKKLLTI